MKNKNKGFTLIELLVVIAILGILSTIIIPNVIKAKQKAKDTEVFAEVNSFKKALNMYYADYGNYPLFETNNYNFVEICTGDMDIDDYNNLDTTLSEYIDTDGLLSEQCMWYMGHFDIHSKPLCGNFPDYIHGQGYTIYFSTKQTKYYPYYYTTSGGSYYHCTTWIR
jgi:prepilin-type N-terminal cleavage/methylation domain-containing protein